MSLLQLFFVFMKIGIISFGGGYAMIPFLQYEIVSRGWLTEVEIIDMVAMSQITPGPIATNMATFVGYNQGGVIGAITATLGVTLPSFILVIVVTKYIIKRLPENIRVGIFAGLQPMFIGLIFCSCITLAKDIFIDVPFTKINIISIIITALSLVAILKFKVSSIKLIVASAIIGAIIF